MSGLVRSIGHVEPGSAGIADRLWEGDQNAWPKCLKCGTGVEQVERDESKPTGDVHIRHVRLIIYCHGEKWFGPWVTTPPSPCGWKHDELEAQ